MAAQGNSHMQTASATPRRIPRIARVPSCFIDHGSLPVEPGDVANKQSAMSALDRHLGFDEPPALEYIVVEETQGGIPGLPFVPVGFGHAVLRYRLPSGAERIANITKSGRLCEFWESPADYLLGSNGGRHGAFARQMYSLRIQEWDDSSVMAMHHFLCAINASKDASRLGGHRRETARFDLTGAFTSFARHLGGGKVVAAGNCSNWTSKALHLAGLVDRPHTLPKSVFIDLYEEFVIRQRCPDAKVVLYQQAEAGKLSPTATDPSQRRLPRRFDVVHGMCSPFMFLRQICFWDIAPLADAVLSIDTDAVLDVVKGPGGQGLQLREGELGSGVGGLQVVLSSPQTATREALAEAEKRLEVAKGHIYARVRTGPGARPRWYRYALLWKLHSALVAGCVLLFLVFGYPHDDAPGAALLARSLLCLVFLIIHAAVA